MRTILWDLDRNAGEIPFNFDCLRFGQQYPGIIFFLCWFKIVRKTCSLVEGNFFSSAVHPFSVTGPEEEDKRLY